MTTTLIGLLNFWQAILIDIGSLFVVLFYGTKVLRNHAYKNIVLNNNHNDEHTFNHEDLHHNDKSESHRYAAVDGAEYI